MEREKGKSYTHWVPFKFQIHGDALCINIVSNSLQTLDEELDNLSKAVTTKWLAGMQTQVCLTVQVYLVG